MSALYPYAHIIHLFCAIAFVGGVWFESLILSALHRPNVSRATRQEAEHAIGKRAVRVMPWFVAGLFLSGIIMAHRYAPVFSQIPTSAFAIQLWAKILLALSVFAHFLIAVFKIHRQTLTRAWSRYIHRAVFTHLILIVLLAKTLFYAA